MLQDSFFGREMNTMKNILCTILFQYGMGLQRSCFFVKWLNLNELLLLYFGFTCVHASVN